MAKVVPRGDDKASLFLIDPNPPGAEIIPQEDLFMYVSFKAKPRKRGVLETGDGLSVVQTKSEGEINFIATEVIYGDDGKTPINDGKTYATTNWTDIGGNIQNTSTGSLEGFGIESINITYGASLVPKVEASFVDLRGSSLFDIIDADDRKTPYSIFFDLPYPVFELTVKGYFGQAVTYCLHMLAWTSEFDGSSGNFKIKASFVGFQQAFLADMVLGNVIGVVNTEEGQTALNNILLSEDPVRPTPKLDDFLNEISKIPLKVDEIKDTSKSYKQLQKINKKFVKIKQIRSLIGQPIPKDPDDKTKNSPTAIISSKLPNTFDKKDYIVLRDIVVLKDTAQSKLNDFAKKVLKLNGEYEKILGSENKEGEKLNKLLFSYVDPEKEEEISEILGVVKSSGFDQMWDGITSTGDTSNSDPENYFKDRWKEDNFDFGLFNDDEKNKYVGPNKFVGNGGTNEKLTAYDFFQMRNEIENIYGKLKTQKEEKENLVREELNERLSQKLGFNPKIKEVISIIMNNTEAMLLAIYEVSKKAEGLGSERKKSLEKGGLTSDVVDDEDKIYAWPDTYRTEESDTGTKVERKWLGDIFDQDPNARNNFPEIDFVERVVDNYLTSSERIKQTKDIVSKILKRNKNDGFYPLLPGDITNRYEFLNFQSTWENKLSEEIPIPRELLKVLFETPFKSKKGSTDSDWKNKKNILTNDHSKLEPVHMCQSITNDIHKNILKENLSTLLSNPEGRNQAFQIAVNLGYITQSPNDPNKYISNNIGTFGTYIDSREESYILLPNSPEYLQITQNIEPLSESILNTEDWSKTPIENITNYSGGDNTKEGVRSFDNNSYKLPTHDMTYIVWGETISKKILGETKPTNAYNFNIKNLDDIQASEYIGLIKTGVPLIGSNTWTGNTKEARALLLLNTLPFDNPQNKDNNIIKLLADRAKVVKFPKYYLLWLCGTVWRKDYMVNNNQEDPISFWDDNELGTKPALGNSFIYWKDEQKNIESKKVYKNDAAIPQHLINLNNKTKQTLIEYYLNWVKSDNYTDFVNLVTNLIGEENNSTTKPNGDNSTNTNRLLSELSTKVNFIVTSPKIWETKGAFDGLYGGEELPKEDIDEYLKMFVNYFDKQIICDISPNEEEGKKEKKDVDKEKIIDNKDLYLATYSYFKNVYDKWIGGTSEKSGKAFNICGADIGNKNLIDYFKFINRAWCDIGDQAAINLDSVKTLADNLQINVYFFLGKILRDSNFLLQILPSYINFKDPKEVQKMFEPQVNIDEINSSPIYVCIQAGGNSKSLKLPNASKKANYKDDTIVLNANSKDQVPPEFIGCRKPTENNEDSSYSLVAFRVAFGAQNQTIFKNVNLNQQEYRETGEYIKQLSNLVDKRGGTQRVSQGMDLYPIYQTRSYTCKVDGLGCMPIQPLMYFHLDNVPFFYGAYLITNVQHNITPNHIVTNFSGVRQSSISVPLVTDVTTFLNISTIEDVESADTEEIVTPSRSSVNFGVDSEQEETPFNMNRLLTTKLDNGDEGRANLDSAGISKEDQDNDLISLLFRDPKFNEEGSEDSELNGRETPFSKVLDDFGIQSNAQVTILLSNMISQSDGLRKREEILTASNLTDDDKKYKGRGYLLIGGKENYEKANENQKLKKWVEPTIPNETFNLIDNPDQISRSQIASLAYACWYWTNHATENNDKLNDITKKDGSGKTYELVSSEITTKNSSFKTKVDSFDTLLTSFDLKDDNNV